jgi:TRAP-type C4-dicarboxylate transport system substrate-binding protein
VEDEAMVRKTSTLTSLIGGLIAGVIMMSPAAAQTTLKFSHTDTAVGSRQAAAELFAEKVAEYTEGRYKVEVFHSGQLANDPRTVEQLRIGGLDFTVTAPGTFTQLPHTVDAASLSPFQGDQRTWTTRPTRFCPI